MYMYIYLDIANKGFGGILLYMNNQELYGMMSYVWSPYIAIQAEGSGSSNLVTCLGTLEEQ